MIDLFCKFVSISTEPQPRHFMNCYYHPSRPAVAQCPDCGKGLCHECANRFQSSICKECNDKRGRNGIIAYIKPLIGIIVLFILGCIVGRGLDDSPAIMGYLFTCIYGGWSIVNHFFANIFVSLDIHSLVFYYGLKILLSAVIGIFATPIYAIYCIVKLILILLKR